MTPNEIESFFLSVYQPGKAWGTPEMLDEFYSHVSPGIVFHRSPFPDVVGMELNRQSDEAMGIAFSESVVKIDELIVNDDVAVLRYIWEGVHTGVTPSLGIPPTGKHIQSMGCSVYHWKDGMIVEQWDYFDMLGLLQQMGVIPAMA